jgi:hypothetical protein
MYEGTGHIHTARIYTYIYTHRVHTAKTYTHIATNKVVVTLLGVYRIALCMLLAPS